MISKYVEFNIICDICGTDGCNQYATDWKPGKLTYKDVSIMISPSEKGKRDMRKIAAEYGWIHKNGKDICPMCQYNNSLKPTRNPRAHLLIGCF